MPACATKGWLVGFSGFFKHLNFDLGLNLKIF